jgi:prevent-host-death family protein
VEAACATLCHVDVSVRELRNHTARVIAAVESGERVVLTVHGRPVADIVPRQERSERRPTERFLADLAEISALAERLEVVSPAEDFDVGLTTDDMVV